MATAWKTAGDQRVDEFADTYVRDPWDVVLLDRQEIPGACRIVGLSVSSKIDVKTPAGSDGGNVSDRGYEPAQFRIVVQLWTAEQYEKWSKLQQVIRPRPGKGGVRRFAVAHPDLSDKGIAEVLVTSVSGLDESGAAGVREAEIECVQYLPPKKQAKGSQKLDYTPWSKTEGPAIDPNGRQSYTEGFKFATAERPEDEMSIPPSETQTNP